MNYIDSSLEQFAHDYAKAWCSRDPDAVAAFFTNDASLTINDGTPAVGRNAIATLARGFVVDFPDLAVTFDQLEERPDGTAFHWSLTGINSGPNGTRRAVRISGYELWLLENGKIKRSKGHFDAADYARQLSRSP